MCSLLPLATQSVYAQKNHLKLFLEQKNFPILFKIGISKMYKVSRLRDTITEKCYFVYLHAYKVSYLCDSITQT